MPPERTCVACREKGTPDQLLRLVCEPGTDRVIVDLKGRLPGRGAWVHPRSACVERLQAQGGRLAHVLKQPVQVDDLASVIRERIMGAVLDGLSMAAASGSLVGGHDRLRAALIGGEVTAVVVASGASERTLSSLRQVAEGVPFVPVALDAGELGDRIGRSARAALGVRSTRGAAFVRLQLRRLADLG